MQTLYVTSRIGTANNSNIQMNTKKETIDKIKPIQKLKAIQIYYKFYLLYRKVDVLYFII